MYSTKLYKKRLFSLNSVIMKKCANTLQKGCVRYIVFREEATWYAVGMEFNIVESGDTPQEAMLLLFEALSGYWDSARKVKARPTILNQKTDPEYEEMWQKVEEGKRTTKSVFTTGELNIAHGMCGTLAVA